VPKKDVFALLKISEAQLDELLKAAKIPLDLGDYTPHLERIQAIQAAKGNGSYVDAAAKHPPNQENAIAKKDRAMPEVITGGAINIAPEILKGTGLWEALDQVVEDRATGLAESVARAPFDGVSRRAAQIAQQAEVGHSVGSQMLDKKVTQILNDPDFIKQILDDIKKG
jgi:hypothetical protein